jgi:uncharacterized protein (UPF0276 family)
MTCTTPFISKESAGFGLGLRTAHYQDFLNQAQAVDWLEVISDNFLGDGGKPLKMLEKFRNQYNLAFHGVGMSIGSQQGLDLEYLQKIKKLAHQFQPMWVSDHLCWTHYENQFLHDLLPVPYTQECADFLIKQIKQAQDILERQLVLENVSSYVQYSNSLTSEWEFLSFVAEQANCQLLLDVNNIYVSSVNHGFNPENYLNGLDPKRIQQIHLAGHSHQGHYIIDTHDAPVCEEVWSLYSKACTRFGAVATMIERDGNLPALPVLIEELDRARHIFQLSQDTNTKLNQSNLSHLNQYQNSSIQLNSQASNAPTLWLENHQQLFSDIILGSEAFKAPFHFDNKGHLDPQHGLAIYHNAYRVRLIEVLSDIFSHTLLFCGSDYFQVLAASYVENYTPHTRSLNDYGHQFANFLQQRHPDSPELYELAQLEWVLRSIFNTKDSPTWDIEKIQHYTPGPCLEQQNVLLDCVNILQHQSNAWQIWNAIEADQEVPLAQVSQQQHAPVLYSLLVWRLETQCQFITLDVDQAQFLIALKESGKSISQLTDLWLKENRITDPSILAQWLHQWWSRQLLVFSSID